MRLASVSARLSAMMSFSRRIGTVPSMVSRVRWSSLVTTQSPRITRSPGLSSSFRATLESLRSRSIVANAVKGRAKPPVSPLAPCRSPKEKRRGFRPAALVGLYQKVLREQLQDRLVRLVGDRQRRDFQLLLRLLGQQVGAFLVLGGQHEVAGAGLQGVDHVLLERLTGRDRSRVGAERLGLSTHRGNRGIDRIFRGGDVIVVEEAGAGGGRQAKTRRVE